MRTPYLFPSTEDGNDRYSQADLDNHSANLNPDHDQYGGSRGDDSMPASFDRARINRFNFVNGDTSRKLFEFAGKDLFLTVNLNRATLICDCRNLKLLIVDRTAIELDYGTEQVTSQGYGSVAQRLQQDYRELVNIQSFSLDSLRFPTFRLRNWAM